MEENEVHVVDVELSIQFNENESRAARIEGAKGAIAVRHPTRTQD